MNEAVQDKEGGVIAHLGTPLSTYTDIGVTQWRRNRNTVKGAGMRGCEGADYPREASACEGQKYIGHWFRRPWCHLTVMYTIYYYKLSELMVGREETTYLLEE